MKATRTVTLRVPDGWAGRFGSEDVRGMLAAFLQRPTQLAPDPGPGDARLSLSLPGRAVQVVSGLLNDSESGTLRRLIAAHLGELPPARPRPLLPAAASVRPSRARVAPSLPLLPSARPWLRAHAGDFSSMRGASLEPHVYDGASARPASDGEFLSSGSLAEIDDEPLCWYREPCFWLAIVPFLLFILAVWLVNGRKSGAALPQVGAVKALPSFLPWNPVIR